MASALVVGHGPARCGFFLAAAVPPHSPPEVDIEELEDVEEIDEDELAREALFRGMNIRETSSGFMALSPPWPTLAPHGDLLFCWKLGGFATAVICEVVGLKS
ncbi:hypothetical protein M7I_6698 [Glarea lozoyensis 74030]|uniref:Uncharacterized protein n=1 Tax=Glarea lozoyensis (strain ATCC 74030 / MF5533) TaxID=1104152 RepID=H0EVA3_GLAL7|nr:hypothetical protein M7I_6698 [Glarea lozoyensis 74030]